MIQMPFKIKVSIHVLREEDDARQCRQHPKRGVSIHVLREEDDSFRKFVEHHIPVFLSTSSARRTTR